MTVRATGEGKNAPVTLPALAVYRKSLGRTGDALTFVTRCIFAFRVASFDPAFFYSYRYCFACVKVAEYKGRG